MLIIKELYWCYKSDKRFRQRQGYVKVHFEIVTTEEYCSDQTIYV